MISKQQYEVQFQRIFRLLLENKTREIAKELDISTRSVARYYQKIDQRYGEMQRQKTDNTLFLECHTFKNRMLRLYKGLETVVTSPDRAISCNEKAKCAEVAANIAIDVLRMESEGIKAAKDLGLAEKAAAVKSTSLANKNANLNNNNNLRKDGNNNESDESFKECDPNRKF